MAVASPAGVIVITSGVSEIQFDSVETDRVVPSEKLASTVSCRVWPGARP
jgi:hypothetical protein